MKQSVKAQIKRKVLLAGLAVVIASVFWAFGPPSDDYLRHRAVKLENASGGSCSGEQVQAPSGESYILTAGHCRDLTDDGHSIRVRTEDGKLLKRRIIAEDSESDLLLLQGLPRLKGIKVAVVAPIRSHVRTFTSGHGFKTYETKGDLIQYRRMQIPVFLIGTAAEAERCLSMSKYETAPYYDGVNVCLLSVTEMATTAFISPGSSGGMVVDDNGELAGVVSAGDGAGYGYLVPLQDIRRFLSNY